LALTRKKEEEQLGRGIVGAAGGALLGLALAGPPGIVFGGFLGFLLGLAASGERRE